MPAKFQTDNIPMEKLNNEIELDAVVDEDISEIFKTKVILKCKQRQERQKITRILKNLEKSFCR